MQIACMGYTMPCVKRNCITLILPSIQEFLHGGVCWRSGRDSLEGYQPDILVC